MASQLCGGDDNIERKKNSSERSSYRTVNQKLNERNIVVHNGRNIIVEREK